MTVNVTNTVGANNTIVLDGSSKIPAFDGSLVTALSATAFTTGTLATARIDVGTTAGKILQLDGSARIPAISGANLTNAPGPTSSTSDPATDDHQNNLNPHFDSLDGLELTEFFTDDPDGLDCVLEMTCGPFSLEIGEQVPFSFCIIFFSSHNIFTLFIYPVPLRIIFLLPLHKPHRDSC